LGRLLRLLFKDFEDADRKSANAVDDPPLDSTFYVCDAKLMATLPDAGHRARFRHREILAFLRTTEKKPRLDSGLSRHGRGLELAV
jgi:hypothetical protein